MADTSQHELSEPHTNGAVDGLTEEEKSKMRPADIDADMREMERRKRVEMMMNSRLFREELERIIETQMKDGGAGPSGLLQQISDMMGAQGARFNSNVFKSSNCVVPINDIRGVESMGYAKGEKLLRCKLAAVFRLLDLYGWTQGVGGHITARLNQDQEHFLVNPYGLLYHEVTASSLVKVDMQGTVVEQGTTNFGVHVTGFQLHSTIHAARPDIKCIVHITTPSVIAVSSLKCGLLPLGQESIVIGEASVHQYIGGVFEPEEKEKISRNLGPVNKIMFLTNRGAICCGETVEEAFYNVYNTVLACETQLKLIPAGIDNLTLVSEESRKAIFDASRKAPVPQHPSVAEPSPLADKLEKRWRIGGTEFEALMRMLDNAGFRTGYIYRNPLVKGEPPRPRNDVEVPPAVSSLGYLLEEEELYKQGLWKGGRKGTDRSRWLNSPNVYQKVEILETGTPDPKKITKWVDQNAEEWVTDGSPTHSSTPVKIESALQFVPKNTNPKEFKQLQQQIKDYRRADKISAGPQSHILEGVTWDEAKKMQDATISATGEQVVLVGAASKGIIQRGFQHNATVYKTPYAKNPFDAITDQELDQYKKDVERKQKGDPYDESQSESEALSSFNVSRATHESSTAKSPIQSPVSVTSETEEESRDEPRVLRIETKQVPLPSQPEVVLSDETNAAAIVLDTPVVQQAMIQEVQQQSQNIIQQKGPADATTEFLNEMRRTAVNDPRNDLNRRDCQSSNSSSVSSGHSYGWPNETNETYDKIHLEVARCRTIAPRMTPMITQIKPFSNNKNNCTEIEREKIRNKIPPPVPPKPYIALRHAFFNNYPAAEPKQVSNRNTQLFGQALESGDCKDPGKFSSNLNNVENDSASVFKQLIKGENNNEETALSRTVDDLRSKPVIVGAILKDINDLHTLCLGSDSKIESKDENGNLCPPDQNVIEVNGNSNFTNYCNDNESGLLTSNAAGNLNEQVTQTVVEISEEKSADNQMQINLQNENLANNNQEPKTSGKEISNNDFTTPPRARNYLRMDSVTEVINSMKIDLTPTKVLLNVLPDSLNDISSKYNLDSTDMSIIYSLTPTNEDTDPERKIVKTKLDQSFDNDGLRRLDSCNTDESIHDEETDYIWVDLVTKKDDVPSNETIDLLDSSIESFGDGDRDNNSNQGSDILELPYSTVQELKENDGETFNQDMKTFANQIIAELGDIEMYTHASNFIDEILYDISCLKLERNLGEETVSEVVRDKLNALGIAKDIANSLVGDLPCWEEEEKCGEVIVIDEIVHHVVDKIESVNSSPDLCFKIKKAKEFTNTELKEMQDNCKTRNEGDKASSYGLGESENVETQDPIEVITVMDIDEELNLLQQDQRTDPGSREDSLQTFESSVNESFRSEEWENSSSRFQSGDERLFITLDSFSSSNYSRTLISDDSRSKTEENKASKPEEEANNHGEFYSSCKSCPSPLDCDDCSFIRFKRYEPEDKTEKEASDLDYTNAKSSLESTESDITDHDTLGEAILEFCTIARPGPTAETIELNFSIQRLISGEKNEPDVTEAEDCDNSFEKGGEIAECTQCRCCLNINPADFMSPRHLPPISEEANESLDYSCATKASEEHLEKELDSRSAAEILMADWSDEFVADKQPQKSPEHSTVSLESVNTVEFYSCRDDSNSTAFQSLQHTTESSPQAEKEVDSDVEIIYVADKSGKDLDRTYTLSDTSINSLDTLSSIESDEHKKFGKLLNVTYSADISANIEEGKSAGNRPSSSSSSSDARLSTDDYCFDTTANMADVSGASEALFSKFQAVRRFGNGENEGGLESPTVSKPEQDCMVYSYDTSEFIKLEEALAGRNENEYDVLQCTCSEVNCQKLCGAQNERFNANEPIDQPPRYEDTTLYKVVSEINLNDDDVFDEVPESPVC